jgi:hypothetical protein
LKTIAIVGSGNIGSRHLQALKAVNIPLKIFVVDPNPESLSLSKKRYSEVPSGQFQHEILFYQNMEKFENEIDIAIIATSSKVRRMVIEQIFEYSSPKFFILEKILFQKEEDYHVIKDLFEKNKSKAWINCTRTVSPFYRDKTKKLFYQQKILINMSGSSWGLMSNIIHYLDYFAFLFETDDFKIDTTYLDPHPIQSGRQEYLEITGTLQILFKNGSLGIFTCYPSGDLPTIVDICSDTKRCIIREDEQKAWVWEGNQSSGWETIDAKIVYTSELTTKIAEDILNKGRCALTPYKTSMKLHLGVFKPILEFLNEKSGENFSYFPFT